MSPVFFGNSNELIGVQQAPRRIPPSHERLHAAKPQRSGVEDRLIVQLEIAARNGNTQLGH
jgi:hypothetical protein